MKVEHEVKLDRIEMSRNSWMDGFTLKERNKIQSLEDYWGNWSAW